MASTRLPGKALLPINGRPLIHHVVQRAMRIGGVGQVVLASSVDKANDQLAQYCLDLGADVVRGDEDDVIERFYLAATKWSAKTIIRLTGDNPLIDFQAMTFLLDRHNRDGNDYSCLTGFPCGAVGDIFSLKALEASHRLADGKALCDHVDLYVLEHKSDFKITRYRSDEDYSAYRFTVDDSSDRDRVNKLAGAVGDNDLLAGLNSQGLLAVIREQGLDEIMSPVTANVSPQNQYTAELVETVSRQVPVKFNEIMAGDQPN